jgi:aldose 1-epimerase
MNNAKKAVTALSGKNISVTPFGTAANGRPAHLFTLANASGMEVGITDFGGIVPFLKVPDRSGKLEDVVLGFDRLEQYGENRPYFGAVIGRNANRISNACFTLEGKRYQLAANNGKHHIHGGINGFDKVTWDAETVDDEHQIGLRLQYLSRDGEEGYPGNLAVAVLFTLTEDNRLIIRFTAETDKPTPVNLTHHGYFNLKGAGNGDILGHQLTIYADRYTPSDSQLITTGEIKQVAGTPLDFRKPTPIGERIADVEGDDEHRGYDHNYIIEGWKESHHELRKAASVYEPKTGRTMNVWTTEPAIQLYTSNFLDGTIIGKNNMPYHRHDAFCLETQHYPDSPNKPHFPSVILAPGQTYHHTVVYQFGTKLITIDNNR